MRSIITLVLSLLLVVTSLQAQWVVSDPGNLAQGIVNSSNQIVEAAQTVNNTAETFEETKKIYKQSKEFYDALRKVHFAVRDARKVQKTILLVHEITEIYVTNFGTMLTDNNFSARELEAIAGGYALILEETQDLFLEVKDILKDNLFTMSDHERMVALDRLYYKILYYRNLVAYYTSKNVSVTMLRAQKKGVLDRVMGMYGDSRDKYW